jgi:hypothetical protein
VTLALAAWVSSAGPVGIFRRTDWSGDRFETKAPGQDFSEGSNVAPRGITRTFATETSEWFVNLVAWTLYAVVAGVVLVILVAIARALWARWTERQAVPEQDAVSIEVLPEVLLQGAVEREELMARGTSANAVVGCWVRLEESIEATGVRGDPARTSTELVTTVLGRFDVDRAALGELAVLYREARFSHHDLTEEHRRRAVDALARVHADLRKAAAAQARARGAGMTARS